MAHSEMNITPPSDWIEQLQAAIAQARNEVLFALTEPSAFPSLGCLAVVQTLRTLLHEHSHAKVLFLVDSVNSIRQVWPRFVQAAQWYSHQMQIQIVDASLERQYDVCVVDRSWVAYAPLSDIARNGDAWRCSPIAGNPVATYAMEEALEALKRSHLSTWSPVGLPG